LAPGRRRTLTAPTVALVDCGGWPACRAQLTARQRRPRSLSADCPLSGLGIPLDILGLPPVATFDRAAFTVAAYHLLNLFPAEVVGEYCDCHSDSKCRRAA